MKAGHISLGDLGNGEQKKTPGDGIPNTTTAADIEWALHQRRVRRAREGRFPDRS